MIKGYKKLRTVEAGSLIRTEYGFAMVSEYGDGAYLQTILAKSGEYLAVDPNTWVAIIDIEALDEYLTDNEELDFPTDNK